MHNKLFAFIAVLFALGGASAAHAQCTGTVDSKTTLNNLVASDFPDNTTGAITPAINRTFLGLLIGSYGQLSTVNAQTGTSYTVLVDTGTTSDNGKLVTFNNVGAVAVTLGSPAVAGWCPYAFYAQNLGAGTVTITPTAGTINGAASLALTQYQGALIVSDGTNWQVYKGFGFQQAAGDVSTISAAGVLTLGKVNGVSFPSSGTSGGIPFYSSASAISSSALLTANAVMVGGGAATTPATIAAATTGQMLYGSTGAAPVWATPASATITVASPTAFSPGTAAFKMQGLQSGITTITPVATGRVYIEIYSAALMASVANGALFECRFGTGNGPANNAASTGTAVGGDATILAGATTAITPFVCAGTATGLTLNTAIWIDLAVKNTTGAQTVTLSAATIVAHEF